MTSLAPELLRALASERWFGAKDQPIVSADLRDRVPLDDREDVGLDLVEVSLEDGTVQTYLLLRSTHGPDVLAGQAAPRSLLCAIQGQRVLRGERGGRLTGWGTDVLRALPGPVPSAVPLGADQSNSSVRFGDALLLKVFRRFREGENPEVEVGRFLTEHTSFRAMPLLAGAIEYEPPSGERGAVAVLQTWVPNRGTAWDRLVERLSAVLDGAPPAEATEPIRRLGSVIADMHLALASDRTRAEFAPELISDGDVEDWQRAVRQEVHAAIDSLTARGERAQWAALERRIDRLDALRGTWKIRIHGDFHLGQVLEMEDGGLAILDFEGEPLRSLAERRAKRPALRDVAGLLRSLDYARAVALQAAPESADRAARAQRWLELARAAFLDAYTGAVRAAAPSLLPPAGPDFGRALDALELEKAAYEVQYELKNRPSMAAIPAGVFRRP